MHIKYLYLILVIALQLNIQAQQGNKGIFDLRQHDFEEEGSIHLEGDWDFCYDQLHTPETWTDCSTFIRVSESWGQQGDYPSLGKATYHSQILLKPTQRSLMLYVSMINSSAKIWINGDLRSVAGTVSADTTAYQPALKNHYVPLSEHTDTLEIVIQVANYSYYNAGIARVPVIGLAADVLHDEDISRGIEVFFAGSLFAMFLYQIFLYFLYSQGKPNLWLALICLVVAMRSLILTGGSLLLPNLFPDVPFEIWKKIEFGGVYVVCAFFPLYFYHLFEAYAPKKVIWFFVMLGTLLMVMVAFTPQYIYGRLLDICHLTLLLSFVYAIYTVIRAWQGKNEDAKIIFFGVVVSFPFISLEMLRNSVFLNLDIRFEYLVELGVLIFLLFQAFILARHYAKSYKTLEVLNLELEVEVAQRTHELTASNKIKERLLSVISHDVKSPLNSLKGLLSLYNSGSFTKDEFDPLIKKMEMHLSKTTGLVENVLYWTISQRKGQKVKIETVDLLNAIEENMDQMEAIAKDKNVEIRHFLGASFVMQTDLGIFNFTLRNLIANAIKFSNKGGMISIHLAQKDDFVIIQVVDQGIGMSQNQMDELFRDDLSSSTKGTQSEQGTGLGLNLCQEFLQNMGGKLTVSSVLGKGTTFHIALPMIKGEG